MNEPSPPLPGPQDSPPRAFTQGVGTVFQFAGVSLFIVMMSVCCLSSLLGKDVAARVERMQVGWHWPGHPDAMPFYSEPRALTFSVTLGVFFGMALAGIGLGLQAQRRAAPWAAVLLTGIASIFWLIQTAFAIYPLKSILLTLVGLILVGGFIALLCLAVASLREMRADPPPAGHELLPAEYKIPYSHLHQDPPEIRLAKELELRRSRLAIEQKELELLEEKLKRKMDNKE